MLEIENTNESIVKFKIKEKSSPYLQKFIFFIKMKMRALYILKNINILLK